MKTLNRLSVLALVAAGMLVQPSCKKTYLAQPALGALSVSQTSSSAGISALLVGAYAALDAQKGNNNNQTFSGGNAWEASPDNWIYGSVAGGDAHKGSSSTDQPPIASVATFTTDASNGFMNSKWIADYEGIARCNNVLKALPLAKDVTAADGISFTAQARFLRGHYYFDLKKMFNMVPYVDEKTVSTDVSNTTDVWPDIEADFTFAAANLPASQGQAGRVNKWAAESYLAKAYLYEHKYALADPLFTAIIASGTNSVGTTYALLANYSDNFYANTKNNAETVFAIQQVSGDGTNQISNANNGDMLNFPYNSPFRCCGFFQPTLDLANSFRTDINGLPLVSTYNSFPIKNDQGILGVSSKTAFTTDQGNIDPRLDWTVGRRGIPYLDWGLHPGADWIREQVSAGPYSPIKNVYFQFTSGKYADQSSFAPGTANNVNIIRYADVLLMAAEVKAQLGDLTTAQTYVNMIRMRASNKLDFVGNYINPATPAPPTANTPAANYVIGLYPAGAFAALGQGGALSAIYFERKLELAMEGGRFYDLVRWGIASQALQTYFAYDGQFITDVNGAHFTKGKNEYYPIPQAQIDLETIGGKSALKQNPGY